MTSIAERRIRANLRAVEVVRASTPAWTPEDSVLADAKYIEGWFLEDWSRDEIFIAGWTDEVPNYLGKVLAVNLTGRWVRTHDNLFRLGQPRWISLPELLEHSPAHH